MAFDMSFKIDNIKGECKIKDHVDEINVLAWSWGVSNSGSAQLGSGAGSGKANVQDLSFTKYVDLASPLLFKHCSNGKHIPTAVLSIRKAGGDALEYVTITLKDLLVTSVSTGGSGGEDLLTENVSLNFANVTYKYKQQAAPGTVAGQDEMTYDCPSNVTT